MCNMSILVLQSSWLIAWLSLSSWCLVMIGWLFLEAQWACLQFVIVVFPDHTHLQFLNEVHTVCNVGYQSTSADEIADYICCEWQP